MKKEKNKGWRGILNPRIVAVVGILVLVMTYLSFSGEDKKEFSDVPTNLWSYAEISYLTEKGIITGFPDGTFKPKDSITRLQAVIMILREKGITDFSDVKNPGFVDVKPETYGYDIIAKGAELGIINGKVNNKGEKYFDPNGELTRSQMASILMNAYDLQGNTNVSFSDVSKSHWAYSAIQALTANKITTGYGNGKFGTNDSITREQFAVMMARMLDKSFDIPAVKPVTPPAVEPKPIGKKYPDGWVAPVLQSSWSPKHQTNLATLQNELGFWDGGRIFGVTGRNDAIQVVGQSPTDSVEVELVFFMWDGDSNGAMPEAYRIPIIAKELFKLYFENDATKVLNYFNANNIPESFTANGRQVKASYVASSGAVVLKVGRK